jgi:membrane protein DedA with SNARE-associated domain
MTPLVELPSFIFRYGYAVVFLGVALENAGLPIPGEVFLFAAGFLASAGNFQLLLVIALGAAGAVVGDSFSYLLGRFFGERLPRLYCKMTLGSVDCVRRTHEYFARRGGLTVAFGRFVIGVRTFSAPMAGSTGMTYSRFVAYDALGAFIWATLVAILGYLFGKEWERIGAGYRWYSAVLLVVVLTMTAGYIFMKFLRQRRHGPASSLAAPEA